MAVAATRRSIEAADRFQNDAQEARRSSAQMQRGHARDPVEQPEARPSALDARRRC